jgi:deazaflavin-dependent oxidoreductase (nitroreductase family)
MAASPRVVQNVYAPYTGVSRLAMQASQIADKEDASMNAALWLVLFVIVAIGCAAVYVRSALHNETGRQRLLPLLRPLMRVINPGVVRAVQRGQSSFGVVHNIGRRSGITYQTPVDVAPTSDGVLISLPYGPETNWCRNVLAADHCTLMFDGQEMALTAPQVLLPPDAEALLAPEKVRQWRGEGIAHYLSLKYASKVETEAPSLIASAASA